MTDVADHDLDAILALQFTVAWAGETPRLGWWRSDIMDPAAGGDFLARLAPQTAAWASLSLVRESARRTDDLARQRIAGGDGVRTLYHHGFDIDDQLNKRIHDHRKRQAVPMIVFGEGFLVGGPWSIDAFISKICICRPQFEVTPTGRRLEIDATLPSVRTSVLAAALVPLSPMYPMPYVEVAKHG